MNCICLITFRPTIIWCDFLNSFTNYKIFIVIDDNNYKTYDFIHKYKNITFIQINDEKCKLSGYKDVNFFINKLVSGWDKALYYFCIENNNYDLVWFIEDDVFFYNENTIMNIDRQYINDDLLSSICYENKNGNKDTWHWKKINIQYQPPYYCGMMCAVRFSKKILECINNYTKNYKTLFFLEALFPTIANKNNLKHTTISELSNIQYRYDFTSKDINGSNLYHPVKVLNQHISFRELLNTSVKKLN